MSDAMHWGPDVPPNPFPQYSDARMDPSVRAEITFLEEDDPEAAEAWLNDQLALISAARESANRLNGNMVNVPIPPERQGQRPPETVHVYDDGLVASQTSDGDWTLAMDPVPGPDEVARVRERIASLPDGELVARGQWIGPFTGTEETRVGWSHAPGAANDPVRPLMQPHDAPAWPSPETIERPNFPRRSHAPVVLVTLCVRTADGLEETYEIENPTDLIFRMGTELETIDMGDGRTLPGRRSLRELAMFALSPQNWRRLPTRRWHA